MSVKSVSNTLEIPESTQHNEIIKSNCIYCDTVIGKKTNLRCIQCQEHVHVACLKSACTPGDLYGDVFFDFTCAKCVQLQGEIPSSSTSHCDDEQIAREKFVRQRLPWFLIITLAIYNLSIKSRGLSRQGYFHWRSHIAHFIEKNWDYLFEPSSRRRKNWIGSVSGNLSHNSPEFYLSGQEAFNEAGWWRLTQGSLTPEQIYKLYEQHCRKRQQSRQDKRTLEHERQDTPTTLIETSEAKRVRSSNSVDEMPPTDSCSRTIPYMGRKPKVAKQLNIVDDELSRGFASANTTTVHQEPIEAEQPLNSVQSNLLDFLAENLGGDDLSMFQNLPSIAPEPLMDTTGRNDFLSLMDSGSNEHINFLDMPEIKSETFSTGNQSERSDNKQSSNHATQQEKLNSGYNSTSSTDDSADESLDEDDEFQPRIVQVTNFQQLDATQDNATQTTTTTTTETILNGIKIKEELPTDEEHTADEQDNADLTACKQSLFTKQTRRKWPWLVQKQQQHENSTFEEESGNIEKPNENLLMMSVYEEREMLHKLRQIFNAEEKCKLEIPAHIRRYYRKLCIREWKREHGKPLFDLDKYMQKLSGHYYDRDGSEIKAHIIDRYQLLTQATSNGSKSFYARIAGAFHYELFQSPYTQRVLQPFIYRNKKCFPPWLKLMCELQHAVTGSIPQRASVDFCYVRPNHIAAVNALLQTVFWPGIDMSECLSYPDFSVVALYKKLVVGCGFLVPDVGYNEAYISFMAVRPGWQRSGIATFMLYHLIQTCMSKDITLHVSATNPAVVLYQKFGFKIEEVILDFYEKYLPLDSKHSRHAFFLRLMR